MKSPVQLTMLVFLLSIVYIGCDKSLLDVKFDAIFQTDLNVVVPPSGIKTSPLGMFSVSATIDPMSNSDFEDYANKIKEVKVKEVTAEITSINKPVVLLTGNLSFTSPGYSSASWSFANENLAIGKTFVLANGSGNWDNVRDILSDKKEITVSFEGETDEDDVQFTLKVIIKTEVKANPL